MTASGLARATESGFTLVEILVTAVIIAFGLLGLAGLQARMATTQMEAYQRAHALVLAEDMVARINSQRGPAKDGAYAVAGEMTEIASVQPGAQDQEDCDPTDPIPDRDQCEWGRALGGADAVDDDKGFLGALIGARGCIEWLSGNPVTLRVSVAWQGLTETQAPALPCGEDDYGSEAMRRVLAIRVTLANLN